MSLLSLFDREVDVVPVTAGVRDAYGNKGRALGAPIVGVRARRDQVAADEDVADRDQQARTFLFTLDLRAVDGTVLDLSGRDRIVDGGETLEILGTPELIHRRRVPHHWEARAALVEG